ncbi:hypothetical protein HT031_000624 [Scenedesmus sp. PABB004]|nr:hypothetical protein HT031_000624 [Scenedesmus sp. PABB004]
MLRRAAAAGLGGGGGAGSSSGAARRAAACAAAGAARDSTRLAVIGDAHGQWSARDALALKALDPDLVVCVGDVGNEDVALVRRIAALGAEHALAVILGNHDAWYTMTARARARSPPAGTDGGGGGAAAPQPQQPDRVQQQLDALGASHLGYAHMRLPVAALSLVGARPFSKGGKSLRSMREFMAARWGVSDMAESAAKILAVIADRVPPGDALVLLGHNGPAGLGAARHAIVGVDWKDEAGDHGDPDLAAVLEALRASRRPPALVVHGHMHHALRGGGLRQMVHVDAEGCCYLNAATVPRVVSTHRPDVDATRHHFLVVELLDGRAQCAADVWVEVAERPAADAAAGAGADGGGGLTSTGWRLAPGEQQQAARGGGAEPADSAQAPQQLRLGREQRQLGGCDVRVASVHEVLRTEVTPGGVVRQLWDAHAGEWRRAVAAAAAPEAAAAGVAAAGVEAG